MRIKLLNCVALLDFPNVILLNGPNYDHETSYYAGAVTLKKMYGIVC